MVYDGVIKGKYVDLKSCTEDDAEFTLALRKDPIQGKFFPVVDNTVDQQKEWIKGQRKKPGDYFFVVWNKAGERIGTIGVYNIVGDEGESGRIIIPTENVFEIFEASLLLSEFAFNTLKLKVKRGFVYEENKRAIKFNKLVAGRLFPPETDKDGRRIIRLETTSGEFEAIKGRIESIIYYDK